MKSRKSRTILSCIFAVALTGCFNNTSQNNANNEVILTQEDNSNKSLMEFAGAFATENGGSPDCLVIKNNNELDINEVPIPVDKSTHVRTGKDTGAILNAGADYTAILLEPDSEIQVWIEDGQAQIIVLHGNAVVAIRENEEFDQVSVQANETEFTLSSGVFRIENSHLNPEITLFKGGLQTFTHEYSCSVDEGETLIINTLNPDLSQVEKSNYSSLPEFAKNLLRYMNRYILQFGDGISENFE